LSLKEIKSRSAGTIVHLQAAVIDVLCLMQVSVARYPNLQKWLEVYTYYYAIVAGPGMSCTENFDTGLCQTGANHEPIM
jgi:hypothetical protein